MGGGGVFFFNDTATTEIYTLSLHDALPIWSVRGIVGASNVDAVRGTYARTQFAPDAFLGPVGITVQLVSAVESLRFDTEFRRVLLGHETVLEHGPHSDPEGDLEALGELGDHAHGNPNCRIPTTMVTNTSHASAAGINPFQPSTISRS